jgi:nicotinamidase-related amidase
MSDRTAPPQPQCGIALLLIDVINDMDFAGSESLVALARPMAQRLRVLKERARRAGIPTIYINDNFGKWRSDFRSIVEHCLHDDVPGREVARLLQPDDQDYFVLKPKQSAFFGTTLDTLLRSLGARTLIVTGIAGDNCVLFSANDAYLRDFALLVPSDCVASETTGQNDYALQLMARVCKADIRPSTELDLERLASPPADAA